jgi:hypothetical protein
MFDHSINFQTNQKHVFLIEFSEKRIYSALPILIIHNWWLQLKMKAKTSKMHWGWSESAK